MKCAPLLFALVAAACSGDRHPPEPPPEPTEPFEDPVTSNIVSTAVGTTGPVMQNPPAMVAKSTESTASGGTSTTAAEQDSGVGQPHGPQAQDGFGGMGAMPGTGTLGGTANGGLPPHNVSSDGKLR